MIVSSCQSVAECRVIVCVMITRFTLVLCMIVSRVIRFVCMLISRVMLVPLLLPVHGLSPFLECEWMLALLVRALCLFCLCLLITRFTLAHLQF